MAEKRYYRNSVNKSKTAPKKQVELNDKAMKITIADLSLSESTTALLEKNNIKNAAELCIRTEKDMYKLQTLNKRVLAEISASLKKHNLAFTPQEAVAKKVDTPVASKKLDKTSNQTVAPSKRTPRTLAQAVSEQKSTTGDSSARNTRSAVGKVKVQRIARGKILDDVPSETIIQSNTARGRKVQSSEIMASIYPTSKVDFLTTRQIDKNNANANKLNKSTAKELPITKPLPVEEWRKIQRSGKWGFHDGIKTVINPQYDEVFLFKEGLACVELNEKCGYIDSKNTVVIPIEYETAFSFSDGLAVVVVGGKCGYINSGNQLVFPCVYDAATPFEDGIARIKQAGKWGFLSKDGSIRWK